MGTVKDNLETINKKIKAAAWKVNRDPQEIKLVAVTKTATSEQIKEAINEGVKIIGENKVQEAKGKYQVLTTEVKWHLIGHLQTNKVKYAVEIFDLIHSVDSIKLAKEIDKRSVQFKKTIDVLIEVNISGEETKYGYNPEKVEAFLKEISEFSGIKVRGLMTIAPISKNKEEVRPYFRRLRELSERIRDKNIKNIKMDYLSMGMTDDFEIAIEEGANIVRIGRGIFGF
ncbi:MAG: YggS family pyridoxal phosphate-dependent enzyme [Candidatus Infernicultor aquiphilus]|uniref:Pyridoxal phosphate homeostasis protein n=1 Tax=Candidatus Infernicultor aquiphilus TaxID=1805029 RepID=A0A1J5GD30_9BACT|nr:YggS family pyridoxal phosphate-dependent enzyme [bacterium]OIP70196.1 MAG: YggS family pyridoxal phosphate enzyme [Candidatus Atribacteria bacterium CG2_30_33_13]PIU24694.1 MAG: YggS family pyridoxal phosphate-dependent enzyme [Candidatus Atribacteria bacterium CG08_land_8_20_14_0_20_33_29]PIW12373.1 MAG: YggS family pyridoxal phosphate-dependent enzyme [Candidatus Atribacteria bacterium CG17_big_fil_post_rev_8_21_14_2_50_34_11]PIX35310.1 MAG: YggS family pyridoxal phosphate-dependent enzym